MFKNFVSALLIASLLFPTVGCTSSQLLGGNEVMPRSKRPQTVIVQTREGHRYLFSSWKYNALGDITGEALVVKKRWNPDKQTEEEYSELFSGTLVSPAITKQEYKYSERKSKKVHKAVLFGIAGAVIGAGLGYLSNSSSSDDRGSASDRLGEAVALALCPVFTLGQRECPPPPPPKDNSSRKNKKNKVFIGALLGGAIGVMLGLESGTKK